MKKVFFVIVAIACAGMLSAQDTIYPFRMDYMDSVYPIMKDSTSRFIIDEAEDLFWDTYRQRTVWGYRIMVPPKTVVWGLNVSTTLDWHSIRDSVEVRGVVIQVLNDDYNNPICHFTNPLKAVSHRPYDLYWAFDHPTLCLNHGYDTNSYYVDTVLGVYSLYFDFPIQVEGTVYVGVYATGNRPAEINPYYTDFRIPTGAYQCRIIDCDVNRHFVCAEWVDENDNMQLSLSIRPWPAGGVEGVFPIFTAPDTDSFGCPDVEGFAFAGVNAGYPTFVWDTAGEHTLYEMAYGPYDTPTDSLHVVTTTDRFYELTGERLSADVYYQARLRAKCQHACPVHDTVMWTPWSDPIYFYTGDSMPDTSHHQPEEGIAEAHGGMTFTLTPNPARGSATLTVEGGEPSNAEGMQMTMHDAAGREVMRCTLHGRETQLPLAGLPAGLYTVSIGPARSAGGDQLSRARVARLRLLVE